MEVEASKQVLASCPHLYVNLRLRLGLDPCDGLEHVRLFPAVRRRLGRCRLSSAERRRVLAGTWLLPVADL